MSTNTANAGERLKQVINTEDIKPRIERLLKPIFSTANPGNNYQSSDTTVVMGNMINGKTSAQIEDMADALRIVKELFKNGEYGNDFMYDLPRYVRENLLEWIEAIYHILYNLYTYDQFEAVRDFHRVHFYGSITENELKVLEEKYLTK